MNRVISATNGSHDYEFYAPIIAEAWRQFGWEPFIVTHRVSDVVANALKDRKIDTIELPHVPDCPAVTAAQTCRLFALDELNDDDYVAVTDIDMVPLSDFLPKDGKLRTVGWDINGYPKVNARVPMCYVAATVADWRSVMKLSKPWHESMVTQLREIGGLNHEWEADQILLTKRVRDYGVDKFDIVPRWPGGLRRVCRSGWDTSRLGPGTHIDCHAMRPGYGDNWSLTKDMLQRVNLYQDWMEAYAVEYAKSQGVQVAADNSSNKVEGIRFFEDIGSLNGWNSFMIPLYVALELTEGKIIELGSGGSTERLREYAREHGREFETYDSNAEWAAKTGSVHVENWDTVDLNCGLLFVDHAPGERRKIDIERARDAATIVVAHDTEPAADHGYDMRRFIAAYTNTYDYSTNGAWASVMSQSVDLSDFQSKIDAVCSSV